MPQNEPRQKRSNQRNSSFLIVNDREPLQEGEFDTPTEILDFWGVHGERFKKGLTKSPIVVEHPKQTYTLSKGAHYFVIEDVRRRSIACITCPVKHGGILEAHMLTQYRLENGVLFYKGRAINELPEKTVVDKALNTA